MHKTFLAEHDAVITKWRLRTGLTHINYPQGVRTLHGPRNINGAGFFTPFTEENMGLTRSLKGSILMPLLKLQATATYLLITIENVSRALRYIINGELENARKYATDGGSNLYHAIFSLFSLLLEMVKSIVSLVTRSIATVVAFVLMPFSGAQPPLERSEDILLSEDHDKRREISI